MSDLEILKAKLEELEKPALNQESTTMQASEPAEQPEKLAELEEGESGLREGQMKLSTETGEQYEMPPISQQFRPGEVVSY